MKKIATLSLSILFLFTGAQYIAAQDIPDAGTIGLSASIQGSQTDLVVPIWVNDGFSIAPLIGIESVEDNFTRFRVGVKPRFYQDMGSNFGTYVGAQGILSHISPDFGPNDTDFILGALGGGEYFLSSHFSFGIEGQLNFILDEQNELSTGAAVTGTYYF